MKNRKLIEILHLHCFILRVLFMFVITTPTCADQRSVAGKTPCCLDRLTTIICQRQKQQDSAKFLQKCLQNSDFAFVQCCRSCFDQKQDGAYFLNYQRTSELLLTDPITAQCDDRRGEAWCQKFVQRNLSWTSANERKLDCANVPIAFRLCRKSCGYCASAEMPALAIYNYPTANDALRCRNPAKGVVSKRRPSSNSVFESFNRRFAARFPPKKDVEQGSQSHEQFTDSETTEISGSESAERKQQTTSTPAPNDYFLVTDHNYDSYDDDEEDRSEESRQN